MVVVRPLMVRTPCHCDTAMIATSGKPMRNIIPTNMPWTGARNRFPKNVAIRAAVAANQQIRPPIAALAIALTVKPR